MSIRFLHLADIHLGFDRYDHPTRSLDFFYSFYDVIQRHAIAPQVDFVVLAGDLFEHRQILPNVLNQAEKALSSLQQAGIPVLAIEGNHDNRPYGVKTSWLRYLADHQQVILLEPEADESGAFQLVPWSESTRRGGYIDLDCGARVIGSTWYGSMAARTLPRLATAIDELSGDPACQIALVHHGMEGQIARYEGALRYGEILPLHHAGVDYLALGHIHKNYALEGWVFNPGSLEANSMAEYDYERGAYAVTISEGQVQAELVTDYRQRPHYRTHLEVHGSEIPSQVRSLILEQVREAAIDPDAGVMLEVKLTGELGFPAHELDQRSLQQQLQTMTGALVARLNLSTRSREYAMDPILTAQTPRRDLERQVYSDLLASHSHYQKRSEELAALVLAIKDMNQEGRPEAELYAHLHHQFLGIPLPDLDS